MFKVVMIGVMAVFLAMVVKKDKVEYSVLIAMTACILILFLSLGKLKEVIDVIQMIEEYLGDSAMYVEILLKIVGITYVAEFGASLCSDAGYQSVAKQIEFYGKLMIIAVSVPIVMSLLEIIGKF